MGEPIKFKKPRMAQEIEAQTRIIQTGENEFVHVRPHWSDEHGLHVDVFDSKGKKMDHKGVGWCCQLKL
jgi:hypothetical protein